MEKRTIETRIVDDPEFRNEVELTQALRQGLRELQKRGEIAPLLSPRRAIWTTPRVALAASLAAVALGAASFLFFSRQDQAPPGVLDESLVFLQTRGTGAAPDVTWARPDVPGRLELRFDVGLEPAPAYGVRIERVADGAPAAIVDTVAATTDAGEVVLTVDGATLAAGVYQLRLTPQAPTGTPEPITYTLRVTGN